MREDSEKTEEQLSDDVSHEKKCVSKSSHMVIIQPSADLDKYLVDKCHSPTATAKPALWIHWYVPLPTCNEMCYILLLRKSLFVLDICIC